MANTNTTGSAYYNAPAYLATSSTSAQKIPWTYNNTPVFQNQSATSPSALFVAVDPDLATSGAFDGHPFIVRVVGTAAVVTTGTVIVSIYNDNSLTATSGNLIATTGASASITGSATAKAVFSLEAYLVWNSTPATLLGQQKGFVGSAAGSATVVANTALTTQTLAPSATGLNFSLGITYSAGNLASNVVITEFSVERV